MTNRSRSPVFDASPTWRGAARRSATRLLVVCGAVGTEPGYIRGLNSHLCNRAVHVKVVEKVRSPSQVVDYGVKRAAAVNDSYDELWCVVDVDDFVDLEAAVRKARDSPVPATLVVSNPCFELWQLLHFAERRSPIADAPQAKKLLCKHVPDYDKKIIGFETVYAPRLEDAIRNAKDLEPTGETWKQNPSTNMWRLVEAMRQGG